MAEPSTRETLLAAATLMVQRHGYAGLSFRELASAVGIRSASVHYHFATKGDLGAELARRYTARAAADLDAIMRETSAPGARLRAYAGLFRRALVEGNRMCLCGMLAAEADALPEAVRVEARAFAEANTGWLAEALAGAPAPGGLDDPAQWALAVFAAVSGAQLVARGRGDVAVFDAIIAGYRASGLIPDR